MGVSYQKESRMKKTGSLILSLLLSVSLLLSGGVLRVEAQEADASLTQTATTEKKENGASEDSSAETPTEETDSAEKATEPSATIETTETSKPAQTPVLLRAPAQTTVSTMQELKDAITSAPAGQKTDIVLSGDISISETVAVPAGKDIRLTTNGTPASLVATNASMQYLMSVEEARRLPSMVTLRLTVPKKPIT